MKSAFIAAGAVVVSVLSASLAMALERPVYPAEKRYGTWFGNTYVGNVPACDSADVLGDIQSRFSARENEYWHSGLEIAGFDKVREIGLRTQGVDYIPRRYCVARVFLNDRQVREVSFTLAENLGPIGFGYGLEWCISGLDRLNAFAPNCKMIRP